MKKLIVLQILMLLVLSSVKAQKWVDTLYSIQLTSNIAYGSSIDFAGTQRTFNMNICVPTNDTVPACGRPLLLAIHGGAFLAGSKDGDQIPGWVANFAKRGYTTASINYRLGMFQTNSLINCNVSAFGVPWNCLNMQDTMEWYRGAYRAMQDAKGALRFLISNASTYNIDPRNVFIVGESAGAITALNVAFLDDDLEKPTHAGLLPDVLAPNSIYENQCIQTPGFATNIASMQLARPDLGGILGDMNTSNLPYTIKGVGSFYGGMMSNLFVKYSYTKSPVLYLYHQPNDLVVPYNYGRIEEGVSYAFTQFPANCQYLINTPFIHGSKSIRNMIDTMTGTIKPVYMFDSTLNNADWVQQLTNASLVGHSVDNSWLRAFHMAQLFATEVDSSVNCGSISVHDIGNQKQVSIYPNPANRIIMIDINESISLLNVIDLNGRILFSQKNVSPKSSIELPNLSTGYYLVSIFVNESLYHTSLSIIK